MAHRRPRQVSLVVAVNGGERRMNAIDTVTFIVALLGVGLGIFNTCTCSSHTAFD
jgi:Mn2+/Fe2+ NRAMP family transporter